MQRRKNIYKQTWQSPDGQTRNQIDHVVVEARHLSKIEEVRSQRGAGWETDHFMVRVKYKQKIAMEKESKGRGRKRYDTRRIKEREVKEEYREEVTNKLGG